MRRRSIGRQLLDILIQTGRVIRAAAKEGWSRLWNVAEEIGAATIRGAAIFLGATVAFLRDFGEDPAFSSYWGVAIYGTFTVNSGYNMLVTGGWAGLIHLALTGLWVRLLIAATIQAVDDYRKGF